MKLDILRTLTPVPYRKALEQQHDLHRKRVEGKIPDTLWLLEHPPVFTTGIRRNQDSNIVLDPAVLGAEVVETERGGEITYHGPGQLVGYIFVNMENHGYKVKKFVKNIEKAFIDFLEESHNISAQHDENHTGVWVGMKKITAIGIALRSKVTFHGFAFNVNTNLSHFDWIVPCGITDAKRGITSMEEILAAKADFSAAASGIIVKLVQSLGYDSSTFRVIG